MRGKPPLPALCSRTQRITPAHAGKTLLKRADDGNRTDHPRACGENAACSAAARYPHGSPPRMRGKRGIYRPCCHVVRITPAHAGKTLSVIEAWSQRADHPRACGENGRLQNSYDNKLGSPPRMRGKQERIALYCVFIRITPAHAGKTQNGLMASTLAADHPRACGENSF